MLSQRFWDKVDKNGPIPSYRPDLGPCWIWLACKDSMGYGQFTVGGGSRGGAHRISYIDAYGAVERSLHIDHLCRVSSCVNPSHLEAVTPKENAKRGVLGTKQCCNYGHPLAGENIIWGRNGSRRNCRTCHNEKQKIALRTNERRRRKYNEYQRGYRAKRKKEITAFLAGYQSGKEASLTTG